MNLHLTEQQLLLRESMERLFLVESTSARVRAAQEHGIDAALWTELLACGVITMRVPEAAGGAGMGLFEASLVAEKAGRYLAAVPLAEALPAARLLAEVGGTPAARLLVQVQNGMPLALVPRPLRPGHAEPVPAGQPCVMLVLDGDDILAIMLPAMLPQASLAGGLATCLLAGRDACGERVLIARGLLARRAFDAACEEWKVLKAAMLAGLAQRALEMAAAYAGERQQFGKPIGAFQGIAHPLADSFTDIEGARLLVWRAIWSTARGDSAAGAYLSMAWWWTAQASARAAARALHTFGGYGVSLEYDIQLYYLRAKAWALHAGDPQQELHTVADRLWSAGGAALPEAGEVSIEFGVGAEADAFAAEVRQFFRDHMSDSLRAQAHHSVAGYNQAFQRKLAQAGMLFPHWPLEYGGSGRDAFDMAALAEVFEEFGWQRITGPVTNQVGQTVMRFGDAALKDEVLPRFASGDAVACLGFSEPSAGSDVFAAATRAERIGGHWMITGQKMFTTGANVADYIFLLARTAPDLPKHAGLTLFLVPMSCSGIEVQPVMTIMDERTNITYLADVRVDDRYRIGEVNGGLAVMAATLEIEHGGDQYRVSYSNMVREAVCWAQQPRHDGPRPIEERDVRRRLARAVVHSTIATDLCYRSLWASAAAVQGRAAFGPMSKLFSTEMYQRDAEDLMDLAAPESLFCARDGLGSVELGYRQAMGMTIYGGTSEVHRSLIAEQGLGLPRSRS